MRKLVSVVLVMSMLVSGMLISGCQKKEVEATEEVVEDTVKIVEAYGDIISDDVINVIFDFPAKIVDIRAKEGQLVQKGDVLFTIDLDKYSESIEQKANEITVLELELEQLKEAQTLVENDNAMVSQQLIASQNELGVLQNRYNEVKNYLANNSGEEIQKGKNQIQNAKEDYDYNLEQYNQKKVLLEEGILTQEVLNDYKRALDLSENALEDANLSYDLTIKSLKTQKENLYSQILMKNSEIRGYEINKDSNNVNYELKALALESAVLDYNQMKEHMNKPYIKETGEVICHQSVGVFNGFNFEVGDYLSKSVVAYNLINPEKLKIVANIPEDFIGEVDMGAEVSILPTISTDEPLIGEIAYIADMAIKKGGESLITIFVNFDDENKVLKPNYSVDLEIRSNKN